ncbi:Vitamin B12 import ATP-binding protein BtuD [Castellaniella defragrans]
MGCPRLMGFWRSREREATAIVAARSLPTAVGVRIGVMKIVRNSGNAVAEWPDLQTEAPVRLSAAASKVDVRSVSKIFSSGGKSIVAIDDASLQVRAGEFVSLIGPSGCGKSTLLYMIAGFIKPDSGSLLFDGLPVTGPGVERGIVFQEYALFPWRTVIGNVLYGLQLRADLAPAERTEIAQKAIESVGLGGFERQYPRQLSGGMKQRVAIARTLACKPDLLLLDEPYGALDALTREDMQDQLLDIWRATGQTVIMVTHDVSEAVYLSQRVVVMSARPSRTRHSIVIDVPREGTREEIMGTRRFVELQTQVRQLVHEEARLAKAGLAR